MELSKQTVSDHFPIICALQTNENLVEKHNEHFVYRRYNDEKSAKLFKQKLHETTWDNIKYKSCQWRIQGIFSKFSVAYTKVFFPKKRIRVKLKKLNEPLGK